MVSFYFTDFKQEYIEDTYRLKNDVQAIEHDTTVLSFLRYPSTPTKQELNRSLAGLIKGQGLSNIIFINFRREGNSVLSSETTLLQWLKQRNLIIPVFDEYCNFLCFFGIEDEYLTYRLKNLLYGCSFSKNPEEIEEMSQKGTVRKILEANSWLFQRTTDENSYWNCIINPHDLFEQEIINEALRVNARITGTHIELLSGHHTSDFIQPMFIFKDVKFLARLARELFSKIEMRTDFDTISTFSYTGRDFAHEFQREIEESTDKKVELVCLENYNDLLLPPNFLGPTSGRKVFIVLDVNNTGKLLERMVRFWQEENKSYVVGIGVVIDTGNYNGNLRDSNFYSLCTWGIPEFESGECPLCDEGSDPIWYIDENSLRLIPRELKPLPENLKELLAGHQNIVNFWENVARLDALTWHVQATTGKYEDRHYLAFINTEKLLQDSIIKAESVSRIIRHYKNKRIQFLNCENESDFPFGLIICSPNMSSERMAQDIQHELDFSIEKVKTEKTMNEFRFADEDTILHVADMSKRVLIIDDGANTGGTLSGLLHSLKEKGVDVKNIEACVLIDRLMGTPLRTISDLFKNEDRFYSVYKVAIPPYVENKHECPFCREIRILDADISQSKYSKNPLIYEYCRRRQMEVQVTILPRKEPPEKTEKIISWNGVKLPSPYFRAFLLELLGRSRNPMGLIELLKSTKDPDVIMAVVEAIGMFGMHKGDWSRYFDYLLELGNQLESYELRRVIFRTAILSGLLINEKILDSIINFIVENVGIQEELPFLAWLSYRVWNPQFKNLLIAKRNISSKEIQKNIDMIIEAIEAFEPGIIQSKNNRMNIIYDTIQQIAQKDVIVLIYGETGTGKNVLARQIHDCSLRKDKSYVELSCASLSETLIETELFGHERGAFTGALKQKIGRFELANGGTVFLNEVSEISFQTQLKLLRVLEEEKFERVGGTKTVSVDIRLIAATNRNLEEAVKEGKFRQDLYYRLNVVRIDIPPLRERREDIKSFVYHFLKEFNSKFGTQIYDLPDDVWSVLESYDWPGNVRELENAIQRAVALAKNNVIDINDLPNEILKSYKYNMESTLNDNELPESLNSQQKKLWNWMKDHKQPITTKIYMDITNRSREEARRDFNDLVNKGFLKREGKGRNTEYYFTKNSSR